MHRYILITGASSGIGRAISVKLSQNNFKCILVGRSVDKLEETCSLLNGQGHLIFDGDINDESFQIRIANEIPSIDGLVHSAGIIKLVPWKFVKKNDFELIMHTNFFSPFFLTQSILKTKKLLNGSSIIFISSISGPVVGAKGNLMYSASKSAINGLVKTLSLELADKKIRVNAINPGMVLTEMWKDNATVVTDEQLHSNSKLYPLGYGTPENIAGLILFLISNDSSWITGTAIIADGGFTIQ